MVDHTDDLTRYEQSARIRQGSRVGMVRSSRRVRRLCLAGVTFVITVVLFAAIAAGLLSLRLSRGPITVAALDAPVLNALSSRLKPGFHVGIGGVDLEAVDGRPAITLKQMTVRDDAGRPILRAPRATVSVDPLKLLGGAIVPTRLDVHDVVLRLSILPDGSTALSAGTDDTAPLRLSDAAGLASDPAADPNGAAADTVAPAPGAGPSQAPVQRFAAALAGFIDRFSDADQGTGGFNRLGVDQGTLVLDDRTHGTVTSFGNLDIRFQKSAATRSQLTVSADGAQGRWSVHLSGAVDPDGRRSLSAQADGIVLDDLKAIPALREIGLDTDLPFKADVKLGLDPDGSLAVGHGRLTSGNGFVRIHDPDHEPLFIDTLQSAFHYDGAQHAIVIDQASVTADTSTYELAGAVAVPAADGLPWAVSLAGKGVFGPERPGEKPLALDDIEVAAHLVPADKRMTIDKFRVAGPQVDLLANASFESTPAGALVKGGATAGRMPAQALLRIWPTPVAADVRSWLLVNLQGGTVERGTIGFALDDNDLAKMKALRSVADSHLHVDYAVSGVTLAFMSGVPPLQKVNGHGTVTGDTSAFVVDSGVIDDSPGHELAVAAGGVTVPSTDLKPSPATITAHVIGGVDTLTQLLSREALKPYADVPSDLGNAHGQIDGTLTVGLKIGKGSNPKDVKVGATAQISDLVVDKLVGKQNLTDGQLGLVLDAKTGLHLKGDARIFGAPTTIDVRKAAGAGAGEADAVLTLDDAARVKAGMNLGRQLTGPVTAKVSVALGNADRTPANVDLDLSKASINDLLPGLSKAPGKPGRATLTVIPTPNGVNLDNIACDIGSFALRGTATLSSDGDFQGARLSQVRLSPGDDMKADVSQGPDGLKITVRGSNIDARPFLKNLTGSDGSSDGNAKPIDVDLHAAVLTGQNSQALTSVELHMAKRDGQLRRLQLLGKLGRSPVEVKSSQQGRDLVLDASSDDAGATLAFLDLYKKVSGGNLDATIKMAENKFEGYATIHNFALREDPAMTRLTEEGLTQEKKKDDVQIDTSNLRFTKLYVLFGKTGPRMNIKDGGMFGPQMGATVQGWIDLAHDKLQLNGTYVPAYGLNNLFSQIPVFGTILGGDSHEGLFGINYRLTGSMASPNLTVDPLSALAPGFLRKIFGAISEATQEGAAPTVSQQQSTPDTVAR